MEKVYIDGNNGANFVDIQKLDDNRFHLKIGDCCVPTIDIIFTAEVFSNFLTNFHLKNENGLLGVAKENLQWDEETNKKYLKGCKDLES